MQHQDAFQGWDVLVGVDGLGDKMKEGCIFFGLKTAES